MSKIPFIGKSLYDDFMRVKNYMHGNILVERYSSETFKGKDWEEMSEKQKHQAKLFGQAINFLIYNPGYRNEDFSDEEVLGYADKLMKNVIFKALITRSAGVQIQMGFAKHGRKKFEKTDECEALTQVLERYQPADMITFPEFKQFVIDVNNKKEIKLFEPTQ